MTESKNKPKPAVTLDFNWSESVKKAEQQGPAVKTGMAPSKPGGHTKAPHDTGAAKRKSGAPKSQQRVRVKV